MRCALLRSLACRQLSTGRPTLSSGRYRHLTKCNMVQAAQNGAAATACVHAATAAELAAARQQLEAVSCVRVHS